VHRLAQIAVMNAIVLVLLLGAANLASALFLKYSLFDKPQVAGGPGNPAYAEQRPAMEEFFREYADLEMEYRPFVGWTRLPFNGTAITINENGDRVHHPPAKPSPDAPLVRFFGGSTMWGTGAVNDGTIPALFNRAHARWQVVNHGETAYTSMQALAKMIGLYTTGRHADLVVFYDGVNDVGTLCRRELSIPGTLRQNELQETLANSTGLARAVAAVDTLLLEDTRRLARALAQRAVEGQSLFSCATDPARANAVAEHLVNVWRVAHDIVTARGGQFVAILQPAAYIGKARVDHIAEDLNSRGALGDQFRAVYPLVREKMRAYDYMFDFSEAFDGDDYIFTDWAHVNARGNAIIAQRLDEVVGGAGLERIAALRRKPSS
jgi:hypothetical protein